MASFFGSHSQRTIPGGVPVAYVSGPGPDSPTAALRDPSGLVYTGPSPGVSQQYTVAKADACCNTRNLLFGVLSVLFLGLVAAALYLVILPSQNSALDERQADTTHLRNRSSSDSAAFDCFSGFWDWQKRWSEKQQAYCCKTRQRACKPVVKGVKDKTSHPRHVSYDCYSGSVGMWTEERRTKCCASARIGCLHTAQYDEGRAFDCTADYNNWENVWSADKKAWCCKREGAGCTRSSPYDCVAGYSNWEKGWSEGKKTWCCRNQGRGCIQNSLYDCSAGYANWKKGWSEDKKGWCCKHESRGCTEPYDCHAGFSNWQKGWSAGKKDFCCRKHQLGCTVAEPTDLYDCKADFEQWKAEWPKDKMSWCCRNKKVACVSHMEEAGVTAALPVKTNMEATPTAASAEEGESHASTTVAFTEEAHGSEASTTAAVVRATDDANAKTVAQQASAMETTTSEVSTTPFAEQQAAKTMGTSHGPRAVTAEAERKAATTSAVPKTTTKISTTAAVEDITTKVANVAATVAPPSNGEVIVMGGPAPSSTNLS